MREKNFLRGSVSVSRCWQPWRRAGCGGLICVLLLGCQGIAKPSFKPMRFQRQEDAGAVQVGIQSVAPFDEYVDSLQPHFQLDETKALDLAITQTQIEDLREIKALLTKIAVALPSTTKSVEKTLTRNDDKETTTRTETQKEIPPTAPTATAPTVDATLAGLPAAPAASPGIDAALRYRVAASLFQDVAFLSSYVKEAAVRTDTTPYIVRLLVTVLPSSRLEPYDAYANVSFFLDVEGKTTPYLANSRLPSNVWSTEERKDAELGCNGRQLHVIPLFVTDNLESSSVSAAREAVRGTDVSAGGIISNIGFGGGINQKNDSTAASKSNDLNGIQTLAVTSDNTVQVRLGAAAVQGGFQTVARTYNLTVLVLAPSYQLPLEGGPSKGPVLACDRVRFFARSAFRDAETGTLLTSDQRDKLTLVLKTFLRSELGLPDGTAELSSAVEAAEWLDYLSFSKAWGVDVVKGTHAAAIWPEVVRLSSARGISRGSTTLPKGIFNFFPLPGLQDPKTPILDDGKTASVFLYGGERLEAKGLFGEISFAFGVGRVRLQSPTATITQDRRGATLTFPSVKAFFSKMPESARPEMPKIGSLRVEFSPTLQRWSQQDRVSYRWEQQDCPIIFTKPDEKPKPDPLFALNASADFIRERQDHTGEVAIEIKKTGEKDQKVLFSVQGAILTSVDPAAPQEGGVRAGSSSQSYVLALRGLLPGKPVTIHSWRMEGDTQVDAPDVVLQVVPAEPCRGPYHDCRSEAQTGR